MTMLLWANLGLAAALIALITAVGWAMIKERQ